MAEKYFDKFNKIYYSNNAVIDITQRAVVLNSAKNQKNIFYPYDITNEVRADQISDRYYDDQFMSWLIYLSNSIVDPYYDWYMTDADFTSYLKKKYSVEPYVLQEKVAHYRNNWAETEQKNITVSMYESLSDALRKYWTPEYGQYGETIEYTRKKDDVKVNTNFVVKYEADGSSLIVNEVVLVNFNDDYKGKGQIVTANSTSVIVQHTYGTMLANSTVVIDVNSYIYGLESHANVAFTSSTSMANNIPLEEVVYWNSVSIYDMEYEMNSRNKHIDLLDSGYALSASKELKKLLK